MNLHLTHKAGTPPINGEGNAATSIAQVWAGVCFHWQLRQMKRTVSQLHPLFSVTWERMLDVDHHVAMQMVAVRMFGLDPADAIALTPLPCYANGNITIRAGLETQEKILLNTRMRKQTMRLLACAILARTDDRYVTLANPSLSAAQNIKRYAEFNHARDQRLRADSTVGLGK